MKKKNQFILSLLMFSLIFLVFTFTASASDVPGENIDPDSSCESLVTLPEENEGDYTSDEARNEATYEDTKNVFDDIYSALKENADKIFAALAFVGSIIVSFAYKKGLLPLLSGAIASLKGSVENIRDNEKLLAETTDKRLSGLYENMQEVVEAGEASARAITEINNKLSEAQKLEKKYASMQLILNSQIDMLYAIFMSSALPQYQKEEVGNKINQMKEELAKYDGDKK